jgi:hypothetical protein
MSRLPKPAVAQAGAILLDCGDLQPLSERERAPARQKLPPRNETEIAPCFFVKDFFRALIPGPNVMSPFAPLEGPFFTGNLSRSERRQTHDHSHSKGGGRSVLMLSRRLHVGGRLRDRVPA